MRILKSNENKKAMIHIIIIACFIAVLLLPVLYVNRTQGLILENENRYAVNFPRLFDEEGNLITDNLQESLTNWFNDNFGFRDELIKLRANILVKLFHISSNYQVEIGRDGWYFYTQDNNIGLAKGDYPLSEKEVEDIVFNQQEISNRLKEQGIDYVLLMTPSKVSVYPENIKSGNYVVGDTAIDIISTAIRNNSDVKVYSLKPTLLEAKQEQQVYFKTDTHWNEVGAYISYCNIVDYLRKQSLLSTECARVEFTEGEHVGEFGKMMGDAALLGTEKTLRSVIISPKATQVFEGDIYEDLIKYVSERNIYGFSVFENKSVEEGKTALLVANSMFASWNMTQLLAENFSTFVFVWSYNITQELIDIVSPDMVLVNYGERYDNYMDTINYEFGLKMLQNPSSNILSVEMPDRIRDGESTSISVTVKNMGTEAWSERKWVRLGLFVNGRDCGIRGYIEDEVTVLPGEEYVFILEDLELPTDWNDARLEWTMLQESKFYFGEKYWNPINASEYSFESQIGDIVVEKNNNSKYNVSVAVKNTGNFIWNENVQVRLGLFHGTVDTGSRSYILNSQNVNPGETYVFDFYDLEEEQIGDLYVGMLYEGITYFGERKKVAGEEGAE